MTYIRTEITPMLPCEYVAKRSGGYQCVSKEEFAEVNSAQNTLMGGFLIIIIFVVALGIYKAQR